MLNNFVRINMLGLSVCVLLSGFRVGAQSDDDICVKKANVRYVDAGQVTVKKVDVCFDSQGQSFYSEICKSKNCMAFALDGRIHRDSLYKNAVSAEYGKLSFHLCKVAGGTPKIAEYQINDLRFKSDFCQFKDSSFINTALLYERYNIAFWNP